MTFLEENYLYDCMNTWYQSNTLRYLLTYVFKLRKHMQWKVEILLYFEVNFIDVDRGIVSKYTNFLCY